MQSDEWSPSLSQSQMKTKIYSARNEWVGDFDTITKTYETTRSFTLGQVFHHFGNALAVDLHVLKTLIQLECTKIIIMVSGIGESFFAVSSLQDFLKNSEKINYKLQGEQRRMRLRYWKVFHTLDEARKLT